MTPLKCGIVDTYSHFEVLKKGQAKKVIIFFALGDMEKGIIKAKKMTQAQAVAPRMENIPPKSSRCVERRRIRGLYIRVETPKD